MTTIVTISKLKVSTSTATGIQRKRIESIDLLRGIVMIIMALDHVRDYFHYDAFLYDPTDLSQTTGFLFFTRFITHYCAPVFVFLAGISAYLYGIGKSKMELARYLLSRGIWLVLVELVFISLAQTFNPSYPRFNLQVIWAIGICMIVLSALIFLKRQWILAIAIMLIGGHNFLDNVHVTGNGTKAFLWSLLHKPHEFVFGNLKVFVHYPVVPWIGIIAMGFYFGSLYNSLYNAEKRKKILLSVGVAVLILFSFLRAFNIYGDAAHWSIQKNFLFSLLSFINVTKYPPSLLYVFITLGPAMIFLGLAEKPLNSFKEKIVLFGKVPFFYYIIHLFLIHLLAVIGAMLTGYKWTDMILTTRLSEAPALKGYGFNLLTVYGVWIAVILLLFPMCKWFASYKKKHQADKWWLSYL